MVKHAMRRATNITKHNFEIDQTARATQKSQKPKVIWLTGLSGSGKSTIANALEKQMFASGMHSYILDGDNLRLGLNKDLGFTREDRAENVRRVSEVAKLMADAGLVVVVALVSPFAQDRDQARGVIGEDQFLEVWVKTSAEVCAERDPKGLYKKAAAGNLPNLTVSGKITNHQQGMLLFLMELMPLT
jgi:bifunctional enzyme CysN/CysC